MLLGSCNLLCIGRTAFKTTHCGLSVATRRLTSYAKVLKNNLGGHDTRYNRTLWSTYRFSRTCIWRFLALESAVKSCEVQQSFLSRCLRQSTEFRKSPECQILCLLGDIGNPLDEDRQFKAQQYRSFLYEQAKVRY